MMKRLLSGIVLFLVLAFSANAQQFAAKTNLLYDATATINLGVEAAVSEQWTMDISGNYNTWVIDEDVRFKHWFVQPEIRYWLCDKFSGHFFGLHGILGQYNFGGLQNDLTILGVDFSPLSDYRFQGWGTGAGIAYGYDWILGRHMNLEAEIGAGVIYTEYDQFNCMGCGKKVLSGQPYYYVGLTKAALSLVYIF